MTNCLRCVVAGSVQGVGFRAATRREAQRHGLVGHARNLPSGEVEVLLCGTEQGVDAVRRWLQTGPPFAEVTAVSCDRVTGTVPARFDIG